MSADLRSKVLTLTSDFGTQDHYVGAMKGVIARIAPDVRVVDITHHVPSYNIYEGAYAIAQSYAFFPEGTVHVVVVDPGVGSSRTPIAVAAGGHYFVAPDNGVLSQVMEVEEFTARSILPSFALPELSLTFHGRDLFAPASAQLANGLDFNHLGPEVPSPITLPTVSVSAGVGRVLHIDGFGNIITSFKQDDLHEGACLKILDQKICLRADCYAAVPGGELFIIRGSSGYLEVSMHCESAVANLCVRAGEEVVCVRRDD